MMHRKQLTIHASIARAEGDDMKYCSHRHKTNEEQEKCNRKARMKISRLLNTYGSEGYYMRGTK